MRKTLLAMALLGSSIAPALAADFKIDPAHSFIQFQIHHLGFSLLQGRLNEMLGSFSYDSKQPQAAKVSVTVKMDSIDTNYAERDKHLKSKDFFDVASFPAANFVSTSYKATAEGKGVLEGNLTLHGITKPISIEVREIGEGKDPWGGYRQGFAGKTKIKRSDFGLFYDLGPEAAEVELSLFIEGVRQ